MKRLPSIVALLCITGFGTDAWAFHNWQRTELANGVVLTVVEKPDDPIVSLTLLIRRGAAADPPSKAGLSLLTLRLLRDGAGDSSGRDVLRFIDRLNGKFVDRVEFDFATLQWTGLSKHMDEVMKLFADLTRRPVLSGVEASHERQALLSGVQQPTPTPEEFVLRHFFDGGPYSWPAYGRPDSIRGIRRKDVVIYFNETYRPEATVLAAAGDITMERFRSTAERYFGDWTAKAKARAEPVFLGPHVAGAGTYFTVDRELSEPSVLIAFAGPPVQTDDRAAVNVLSEVLTGSSQSRLSRRLRIEKGWSYHVWSKSEAFQSAGLFSIGMRVPYESLAKTVDETFDVIEGLKRSPPGENELAQAKSHLAAHFYFETEGVAQIARFLAEHEVYTHGSIAPAAALEAVKRVEQADIARVIDRYLKRDRAAVVVEGEKTQINAVLGYAPQEVTR